MAAHQLQPVRARCAGRRLAARIHASALPVAPCLSRRAAAAAAAALALFPRPASAEDVGASEEPTAVPPAEPAAPDLPAPPPALQLATWSSATLAFSFEYPLSATDGRPLSWLPTRDAARYSDAAPLSADARQRIVLELANFKGPLTITLTVGLPPPALEEVGAGATPRQVVAALLADRSTGRVSTGQRVSLASLENVSVATVGGEAYTRFETVAQGSPNFVDGASKTYRHAVGATAKRGDYYYTLTCSAPERLWPDLEGPYKQAVASFRLTQPTSAYRDPSTPGLAFW